jgi:hypothetical protein
MALLVVPAALAFSQSLSSEQIRDAYFLGATSNPQTFEKFLEPYIHHLPYPNTGAFVESIEFRSPYKQVALRSRANRTNYSAQDAEQDYSRHPEQIVVRVMIFLTFSYHGPAVQAPPGTIKFWTDEDFLKDFQFHVAQAQAVEPKGITVGPGCPSPSSCDVFDGREVLLHFDSAQIGPGMVTIKVRTRDGQEVQTEFDLDKLKWSCPHVSSSLPAICSLLSAIPVSAPAPSSAAAPQSSTPPPRHSPPTPQPSATLDARRFHIFPAASTTPS